MKKNVLTLMGVSISVFCMCLTACNKNKKSEDTNTDVEVLPFTASVSGLYAFYAPTDKINWDDVGVTLTFENYSTLSLSRGEIDPSRRNYTPGEGEYSLTTSGLYKEDGSLTEGTYPISYAFTYEGELYEGSFDTVVVSSNPSSTYSVYSFGEPSFQITYEENKNERVDTPSDEASEDNFYISPDYYEVGADNPFIYKPSFMLMSPTSSFTMLEPALYQVDYTVTRNGSSASTDYVTYDGAFGFQFTSKAIGETFTISVSPKFFTSDLNGNSLEPSSITVRVGDGYNVYNALDLGRMSLTNVSASNLESYTNGYSEPIFYDAAKKALTSVSYSGLWENYFNELGVSDATATNGVYIQNDIVITDNNIPSEYFISQEEMDNVGNGNNDVVGSLRDYSRIYTHLVDTDFTFNGNLFKIDTSAISWGESFYKEGMNDEDYYYSANQITFQPGHSTLFLFSGSSSSLTSETPKVEFKNVESVGNTRGILTTGDDEESIRNAEYASGSLIFYNSSNSVSEVTNSIIKNYMIGYFASDSKGNTNCLDLEKSKIYDCYNSAIFIRESETNNVDYCTFERFGGPAIFVVSRDNSYTDDDGNYVASYSRAGVTIGSNVHIECQLQGDEAWFTLVGATSMIASIAEMNAFFAGGIYTFAGSVNLNNIDLGDLDISAYFPGGFLDLSDTPIDVPCKDYDKTLLTEDGKFNFYEIGLDYDYLSAVDKNLASSFVMDGTSFTFDPTKEYQETEDKTDKDRLAYVMAKYYAEGDHPSMPVFMSNTGTIYGLQVDITFEGDNALEIIATLNLEISLIDLEAWCSTGENVEYELGPDDTMLFFYYRPPKMGVPFSGVLEMYDDPQEEEAES